MRGRRARAGMGFLLDIVPNHVGVDVAPANPWWWDVLTHGRGSRYASYFDIDWAAGPILLPVPILDARRGEGDSSELSLAERRRPSCATTSTRSRSRRARVRRGRRRRCTPASTTG